MQRKDGIRLIVFNGRDYPVSDEGVEKLNRIEGVAEVVSGGSPVGDAFGEAWAKSQGLPVKRFPPNIDKHGKQAYERRSKAMAEYADAIAVMSGISGFESVYKEAEKAGLVIHDCRKRLVA